MTISLTVLSDIVDAAPGELASIRVLLANQSDTETTVSISIVGVGAHDGGSLLDVVLPAGHSVEEVVAVLIPVDIAVGQHSAALQAVSTRNGTQPVLAPFVVSIESVQKVALVVEPNPIRGRRRARFVLGVGNGEPTPVAFTVAAEAQDVRVKFKSSAFRLLPGQRAATKAKVRGPRHLVGEPIQHNLVLAAHGKASASTITAPFIQRPFFAAKARGLVAALAVVALWLAAIGGVALWVANRGDDSTADTAASAENAALVRLVDANGNVLDDGPYKVLADGTIVDSEGNVVEGFEVDANGNVVDDEGNPVNGVSVDDDDILVDDEGTPIGLPPEDDGTGGGDGDGGGTSADGAGGGDGTSGGDAGDPSSGLAVPRFTLIRGSVDVEGTDDLSDVSITLATIDLGTQPTPGSTVLDPPDGGSEFATPDGTNASKIWSARWAPMRNDLGAVRQTQPVPPLEVLADADGVWLIPNVALRRTYELQFAKPGFDTRSFVIAPPDDGTPVELDVTLEPGEGVISGRVLDGGRPLGGVELAISDGTLTFTTTSSTDGDVGAYSFDGISTPGVYTLTAARSGYGTEVLQLPMGPGQRRTGTDIEMNAGVATLSGRIVSDGGAPLGGVTVTATNGEVSRITTSLTDGNTGFYSIPQLDVPSTYTVTVDFAGYLPQTRRVPLAGSTGGVDFALVDTTAQLTGTVTSAAGGGVVAAGVTLSNADLKFEVATAASPPGAYAVDDLPPGNYTVTVEHFEHDTVTEFIELRAGVDPPPLDITLPLRSSEFDPGRGSLVVEVVDPGAETAEEREVQNATVQVVRTRTGEIERTVTQEPFDFRITDIPIGTYTILVTAVGYNPAAPRQVSIGRSEERRTVELQRLGQATGRVIDSITKEPLNSYAVSLYSQLDGGGELFVTRVVVGSDSVDGVWETERNALRTGIYRATFTNQIGVDESPPGYLVRSDQNLGLPQSMFFEIPANVVEAIELPDLEADPYPNIIGRVYKPFYDDPGIRFEPIDDPTLGVQMRCGGGDLVDIPVTDELGVTNAASDAYDSFFLDRRSVDANNLIGDCEIVVDAAGYETETVTLDDVVVSNGVVLSDRVVNPAVHKPVDRLGGTVFWVDDRFATELPLENVDISATAITRFDAGRESPDPPAPEPTPRSEQIVSQSGPGGAWEIEGHIFGRTQYSFVEQGFGVGIIEVTIDETLPRTVTEVQGVNLSQNGADWKVELEPPNVGRIFGDIEILTTDGIRTPLYDQVGIAATNPFNQTFSTTPCPTGGPNGLCIDRTAGSFEIGAADAGTWTTTFTPPANHIFFQGGPPTRQELLGPEQQLGGFDTSIVELGELDVILLDEDGNDLSVPAELRLEPVTANQYPTVSESFATGTGTGGNLYELDGIAVDATTPLATPARYTLSVGVGGYDQTTSRVFLDGNEQFGVRSNAIPLDYLAGSKPVVTIRLQAFGEIEADVLGRIVETPFQTEPLTIADGLEVTATKVNGRNDPTPDPAYNACQVTAAGPTGCDTIGVRQSSPGRIVVSGPQGYYTIEVSHPEYGDALLSQPVDIGDCTDRGGQPSTCNTLQSAQADIYRLENNKINRLDDEFLLELRDSALAITVLESVDPASPGYPIAVDAFSFEVFEDQNGVWVTIAKGSPGATAPDLDTTGTNTVTLPIRPSVGNYRIEIRKFVDPGTGPVETRYPAIVEVPLARSTGPNSPELTTLTLTAPLPPLGSSISGTLVGRNQTNTSNPISSEPIDLPTITVTRDYAEQAVIVDTNASANICNETITNGPALCDGDITQTTTTPGATTDVQTFSFNGLPSGSHTMTFSVPPGYSADFDEDTNDATVTFTVDLLPNAPLTTCTTGQTPPACIPTLIYTAPDNATVTATIAGAVSNEIFPTLDVRLIPPGATWNTGSVVGTFTADANGPDNRQPVQVTFANVPPHRDDYTLEVRDALHTTYTSLGPPPVVDTTYTAAIPVDVGTSTVGTHTPTSLLGRLSGTAVLVDSGTPMPIDANTVITVDGINIPNPVAKSGDGSGEYEFLLPQGQYSVTMARTPPTGDTRNFTTATATVVINKGLGTVENLTLTQAAAYSITITPFVPSGLNVDVVEYNNGVDGAAFPAARVGTTSVFERNVPAGTYRVRVSGGGLTSPIYKPVGGETVAGAASITKTINIPRSLSVFIDDDGNEERTVKVYRSSDDAEVASLTKKGGTIAKRTFDFTEGTSSTQIPTTGDLYVIAYRNDNGERRSVRADVPDDLQASLSVTLLDVVTVSGTVRNNDNSPNLDGLLVTASSSAGNDITDSASNGDGSFDLDDLHNGRTGNDIVWTLTVDQQGVGTGSTTVTIGPLSPAGSSVSNRDITVLPRNLTVTVPVEDANGDPIVGADVSRLDGNGVVIDTRQTALDTGTGDAVAVFAGVPEDFDGTFRAELSGQYQAATGGGGPYTSYNASTLAVTESAIALAAVTTQVRFAVTYNNVATPGATINLTPTGASSSAVSATYNGVSGTYDATINQPGREYNWTITPPAGFTANPVGGITPTGTPIPDIPVTLTPITTTIFLDVNGSPTAVGDITLTDSSGPSPATISTTANGYQATVNQIDAPFTWSVTKADYITTYSPDNVIDATEIIGDDAARTVTATVIPEQVDIFLALSGPAPTTVTLTGLSGAITPDLVGGNYRATVDKIDAPFTWTATRPDHTTTYSPNNVIDATEIDGGDAARTVSVTLVNDLVVIFLDVSGAPADAGSVSVTGASGPAITVVAAGGNDWEATVNRNNAPFTWNATRAGSTATWTPTDRTISTTAINGDTADRTVSVTFS